MLEIVILILSVAVNTLLGLSVLINNPKKDVNRLFFFLTLSLGLWSIITYYSLHPAVISQITWVRLVLASAAVQDYFVLTSFAVFPDGNFKSIRFIKPITYYLLFVFFLTQTPLVFKGLNEHSQPIAAPGIIFFILLIFGFLGAAVYSLFRRFRRSSGQIKNQLRVVIFGVITCFAAIVFTNFFLVNVFKNTSLISFAPLLTLILTGSMAYAILKHKLFDLRLAVARAMAYVLTFSLVIVVYSAIAFSIGEVFSYNSGPINSSERIFYVGLAVLTALAFQPVKRFFDRTTNRLFFRDAYEPQELLDELNNILVGNIRLEEILAGSSKTIADHMRLIGCNFLVKIPSEHSYMVIGTDHQQRQDAPEGLISAIKGHHNNLIVADDLPYNNRALKEKLDDANCAAAIKLSTHTSSVGYLLAGHKKSGDILNTLDVKLLGIMADELAIAIQNSLRFEEIQRFNVTLQEKIEAATRELRAANTKLKELDQTKDEFISMASHQLRTPLTTVKGYVSMVLDGDTGKIKKEQKDLLQHAFDGADRMVFLISDLLNVSRLQSGKFVIDNKPTDLVKVVESEVGQLQESAANHQLKLTFHKPDNFPMLNLDENKIRQVIMNFIDNAIYYTPSGGSVEVALEATDKDISYTVTDTGLGVPKAEQHHLFTKFYRAGNAKKMRPDGTGLGLFMAKKVIVTQGGAIIFKSEEGKGSTFGFSFPRSHVELKKQSAPKPEPKAESAAKPGAKPELVKAKA